MGASIENGLKTVSHKFLSTIQDCWQWRVACRARRVSSVTEVQHFHQHTVYDCIQQRLLVDRPNSKNSERLISIACRLQVVVV